MYFAVGNEGAAHAPPTALRFSQGYRRVSRHGHLADLNSRIGERCNSQGRDVNLREGNWGDEKS